ncbi:MAG: RNA methyltransferase [Anaerolineaceae bacterium]|nr:RNA methyltransferase [Anaerolineaceae bacterium]
MRRKTGKIVLEGTRLVRDACESGYQPDFVLYTPDSDHGAMLDILQRRDCPVLSVSEVIMRHISDTQTPQGIAGVFPIPEPALPARPQRVLLLDGVGDPGNVGTMLRTAAASGVEVVLLGPGCADPYNPKALRAGMGAHFRLPIVEHSWKEIQEYCQGLAVYAADSRGEVRYDSADWGRPWAVMIGSEAHGLSTAGQSLATNRVYIPMAAATESINAAAAAAVILFEAQRQSG